MNFLGKKVDNYTEPFIVAEISGNHGGDIKNAYELIRQAKLAGADAVKIQCYEPDSLTIPSITNIHDNSSWGYVVNSDTPWDGETLYDLYKKSYTPFDWIESLFEHAKLAEIPIFSSVFCEKGLEILEKVNCPAYKIASFEANDPEFINKVSETKKPIVISTGMADHVEIARAVQFSRENKILLHCISKYPAKIEDVNFSYMETMQRYYNSPVGFSCHSPYLSVPILAVARGAAMLEMHLKLFDVKGEDSAFSFYPPTFKYVVEECKKIPNTLVARQRDNDTKYIDRKLRRSLYVVEDIKKGEKFTTNNVKSFRPALGCEPYHLLDIIGQTANRDLTKYTPMQMEYVND